LSAAKPTFKTAVAVSVFICVHLCLLLLFPAASSRIATGDSALTDGGLMGIITSRSRRADETKGMDVRHDGTMMVTDAKAVMIVIVIRVSP